MTQQPCNVIPINRNTGRRANQAIETQAKQDEVVSTKLEAHTRSRARTTLIAVFFKFLQEKNVFDRWLRICTTHHLTFLDNTHPQAWIVATHINLDGGDQLWWPLHEEWQAKFK